MYDPRFTVREHTDRDTGRPGTVFTPPEDLVPPTTVACEIAAVTITGRGRTTSFTIPAFTRTPDALRGVVEEHFADYLAKSEAAGAGVSLADFGFFALSRAATEPTEEARS